MCGSRPNALNKVLIANTEKYMLKRMINDVAHDRWHIYRVLNIALDIAKYEKNVNLNVLIVACLLHDIGREADGLNNACHAEEGAKIAYDYVKQNGMSEGEAFAVKRAIESHRYRSNYLPESIEAKILFDADTIDVTGAMGIARSLLYEGRNAIPIYNVDADGNIVGGRDDSKDSFIKEYEFKLNRIYERLYTKRGIEIATARKKIAQEFFDSLMEEIKSGHKQLEITLENIGGYYVD